MRHSVIRIIVGIIWLIVSVVMMFRGTMKWWYCGAFALVGAAFLLSAFKGKKKE